MDSPGLQFVFPAQIRLLRIFFIISYRPKCCGQQVIAKAAPMCAGTDRTFHGTAAWNHSLKIW